MPADTRSDIAFIQTIQQAIGRKKILADSEIESVFGPMPGEISDRLAQYANRSDRDFKTLAEQMKTQAEALDVEVICVKTAKEAGQSIKEIITSRTPEWGSKKSIAAWDHPLITALALEDMFSESDIDVHITRTRDLPDDDNPIQVRQNIIESFVGITSADFCIAQSATLVQRARAGQPRAVSLVPAIHIAVIRQDQMIQDLDELYFRLIHDPNENRLGLTNCMTFITGASKTGDIELVMVKGAHGPRELIIYVLSD